MLTLPSSPCSAQISFPRCACRGLRVIPFTEAPASAYLRARYRALPPMPHPTSRMRLGTWLPPDAPGENAGKERCVGEGARRGGREHKEEEGVRVKGGGSGGKGRVQARQEGDRVSMDAVILKLGTAATGIPLLYALLK